MNRSWIEAQAAGEILEQLCRNAVFAHWMAQDGEATFLVNLVQQDSEKDVVDRFRNHLRPKTINFLRHTWNDVYSLRAIQAEAGNPLRAYFKNKTLRFRPAFTI